MKCGRIKLNYIKLNEIYIYLLMLLIIANTGTACTLIYSLYGNIRYLIFRILLIIVAFSSMFFLRKKHSYRVLLLISIFSVMFIISNIMNYSLGLFTVVHLFLKFLLFLSVMLYLTEQKIDIGEIFYNIMICICLFSLIMYLLIDIIKVPFNYEIYYLGDNPNDFYRFYLKGLFVDRDYAFIEINGHIILRLQGLFSEPGIYAVFLGLTLFYGLYIKKENSYIKMGILLINCLLTFSTTCYLLIAFLIFMKLLQLGRKNSSMMIIILFILPIVVLFVVVILQRKMSVVSGNLRYNDFINGIELFTKSPVIGIGIRNVEADQLLQGGRANTNGLIFWLYTTGVIGMFFLLFPFCINIFHSKQKVEYFIYFMIFIICNFAQPIIAQPLMSIIIAKEYEHLFFYRKEYHSFNFSYKTTSVAKKKADEKMIKT